MFIYNSKETNLFVFSVYLDTRTGLHELVSIDKINDKHFVYKKQKNANRKKDLVNCNLNGSLTIDQTVFRQVVATQEAQFSQYTIDIHVRRGKSSNTISTTTCFD